MNSLNLALGGLIRWHITSDLTLLHTVRNRKWISWAWQVYPWPLGQLEGLLPALQTWTLGSYRLLSDSCLLQTYHLPPRKSTLNLPPISPHLRSCLDWQQTSYGHPNVLPLLTAVLESHCFESRTEHQQGFSYEPAGSLRLCWCTFFLCLGLPGSEGVQAGRNVFVKQDGQVGSLSLDLPLVNPAAHWRVPPQVCRVDVQDPWVYRGYGSMRIPCMSIDSSPQGSQLLSSKVLRRLNIELGPHLGQRATWIWSWGPMSSKGQRESTVVKEPSYPQFDHLSHQKGVFCSIVFANKLMGWRQREVKIILSLATKS